MEKKDLEQPFRWTGPQSEVGGGGVTQIFLRPNWESFILDVVVGGGGRYLSLKPDPAEMNEYYANDCGVSLSPSPFPFPASNPHT